jgi:hypothetical protein
VSSDISSFILKKFEAAVKSNSLYETATKTITVPESFRPLIEFQTPPLLAFQDEIIPGFLLFTLFFFYKISNMRTIRIQAFTVKKLRQKLAFWSFCRYYIYGSMYVNKICSYQLPGFL